MADDDGETEHVEAGNVDEICFDLIADAIMVVSSESGAVFHFRSIPDIEHICGSII